MGAGDGGALLIVRRATGDDTENVRGVRLEALRESPDAFDTTLEEALALTEEDWGRWLGEGVTFLGEVGETTAGIVVCAPYYVDGDARLLASLWVTPVLRGTGLAPALIAAVRDCARREGAGTLYLHVGRDNARARRFYERQGFGYTGGEVARVRDGVIEVEMVRAVP